MKKLIALLSVVCIVGASVNLFGQTSVSKASPIERKVMPSTVDRQMKKGDSQMSRANETYQKAQSSTNAVPKTPSNNRPVTTSTVTVRKESSSNSGQRSITSSVSSVKSGTSTNSNNPKTTSVVTTPKSSSVNSSAVKNESGKVSNNVASKPMTTTSNYNPSVKGVSAEVQKSSSVAKPQATSNMVSSGTVSPKQTASVDESKRGYDGAGKPKPQMAPQEDKNANRNMPSAPRNNPYMHPNVHNFGGHMSLPSRIRPVSYGGVSYYFYNGVFCTMTNGYYVICRPPIGAVIAYSIFNTWRPVVVVYNKTTYYYDDGTFYLPRHHDYVVVAPPVGALIAELPSNYQVIVLEGRVYYKVDNVYYKEVVVNGYLWYEVLFVA